MKKKEFVIQSGILLIVVTFLIAISNLSTAQTTQPGHHGDAHIEMWDGIKQAVCVLTPTGNNKTGGIVRFTESHDQVAIDGHISGLKPNQEHAIHIHEYGDLTNPNGLATGGHYNPSNSPHGLPNQTRRHAGDLGNLHADANGNAHLHIRMDNISVAGLNNPIIGRGMIIHAKVDDGGQPTGNAGARIAQGVIGIAKAP